MKIIKIHDRVCSCSFLVYKLLTFYPVTSCLIFDEDYKNSQPGVHMQFFGVQAFNFFYPVTFY